MANSSPPSTGAQRLLRLVVRGGFLDGLDVNFSSGLNCIIGGRGTGKTTLLEFIRYALDLPSADQARRSSGMTSLIESNLGGGQVWLLIETRDGLRYKISRTAGEPPIVLDSNDKPTAITLGQGRFFNADIFSQNQVEGIADDARSQLDLLDSFMYDPIRQDTQEIEKVINALGVNARACQICRQAIADGKEELGALPEVEKLLAEFKEELGDDDGAIDQAQQDKAQRDRERRALQAASKLIEEHAKAARQLDGRLRSGLDDTFDADAVNGTNAPAMQDLYHTLGQIAAGVDQHLDSIQTLLREATAALNEKTNDLTVRHREQELAFDELMSRQKTLLEQQRRRADLEKHRNELLEQQKRMQRKEQELKSLLAERQTMREQLASLLNRRFQCRLDIVKQINDQVSPALRVGIEQFGDNQNYEEMLTTALSKASLQHKVVARKLAAALSPSDLVRLVKGHDHDVLVERAEINADQAQKVVAALSMDNVCDDLETVELVDLPSIELRDGDDYKDSLTLSTGQKCTSVLPILLLDSVKPLLVDQPEDNLDNRFIFSTVVQRLQTVKQQRQLIFITHNPNIPVLGAAEQVIVLESNGRKGTLKQQGTVDECKDQIVTLLEGGKEAFRERYRRYNV